MRPRRVDRVTYRELADEAILLAPDGAAAFVLNVTASAVWHLCEGARDHEGIAFVICDALPDARPEQVREDVRKLLDELLARGLIEDLDACGPARSAP